MTPVLSRILKGQWCMIEFNISDIASLEQEIPIQALVLPVGNDNVLVS